MKIYEKSSYWLMLRVIQFIFTVFCLVFEIIQVIFFTSLIQSFDKDVAPLPIYFSNDSEYKGEVKIWYDIVIGLSFIGLGFCIAYFKRLFKEGPFIIIETIFFLLWSSSGIANLYPLYDGGGFVCSAYGYNSENLPHEYYLWCRTYVISALIGWMNTLTFVITILFSLIILGQNKKNETILERTLYRFKRLRRISTNITHNTNNTNNTT
ncbi:hypothetical protein C1645_774769 [Glomus cerebriforme]|uniref:MARVEL domain-containing protein n=1 Tax=Glomus cerebriforme TaxID=658196 RepID=A0A397SV49_9GLOM|nr:hypothetical protein C1645_774769 [Glomus cerebriforme]